MKNTDLNCIFCKIVRKEIPAEIVYEDENFLAFLDVRPLSPGHTLLIPKHHYRWVWDHPEVSKYFELAKKMVDSQRKAFNTESIWAKVIGEEVEHAHVWLIPNPKEVTGDKNDFKGNAEKIKRYL